MMPVDSEQLKRAAEDDDLVGALVPSAKKPRNELVATNGDGRGKAVVESGPPRTSSLEAPIMLLSGHKGEIYSCKFHPNGKTIASGGFDRQLYLWNTFGECENYAALTGHKGSILDLQFSENGDRIFTCSSDKTINMWDSASGVRIKKLKAHGNIVNALSTSRKGTNMLASVGDDCSVKIWDTRTRSVVKSFRDEYQLLAVTFNENADQVVVGGIENVVKVYDLRKDDFMYGMVGHYDSVTGLSLSPDGSFVLSNSMDNTLCIWDVRPFAPTERCVKTLHGHQHNFEKNLLRCSWSPDGTKVTAGSADRSVYIWDTNYRRILYKLPGHQGSVNEVIFHPNEPIVLSCSSDKNMYLGEIEA